ncbi:MAG: 2,3-bisphosphoglycerate-independent phosphoglycerate mutase [Candidatus ainarchaeum sp.]|nr:2,3-bisphosphoglycerate-independent phosphoglycerate mutase [Candidatus ainarchaeum sp.]
MRKIEKNVLLTILDGWGLSSANPKKTGNAIELADLNFYNSLVSTFPMSKLEASQHYVGLLDGYMGSSKVGHINIGSGRIVKQELAIIDEMINDGSFFKNKKLLKFIDKVPQTKSIHLLGLVSNGGVHSHMNHLIVLLKLLKEKKKKNVYIHIISDGRDAGRKSEGKCIAELEREIKKLKVGKIASLIGRFYAMDRDKRWARTEKAYNLYIAGNGKKSNSWRTAIKESYSKKIYDEFFEPVLFDKNGIIKNGDSIINFNFRSDRMRQLTKAFLGQLEKPVQKGFKKINANYFSFISYYPEYKKGCLFNLEIPKNTLGEIVSKAGLTQLRIAESEKYAHVTYFFSGKKENPFKGETRKIISSPRVRTYDLEPEMSAKEITEYVTNAIKKNKFNIIIQNYANGDMVGHTGNLKAGIKAVKTLDFCLKEIYKKLDLKKWVWIITADHGNIEQMIDKNGNPHTSHTLNKVPFIFISEEGKKIKLQSNGVLGNIAPTILDYLKIKKPKEMIESLIR